MRLTSGIRAITIFAFSVSLAIAPAGADHPPTSEADVVVDEADGVLCVFGGKGVRSACPTWDDVYTGPGRGSDLARVGKLSPDGTRYVVALTSRGGTTAFDVVTRAYDAHSGDLLWSSSHDAGGSRDDFAAGLALSPDGLTSFTLSRIDRPQGGWDVQILAHDVETGGSQWIATYAGPNAAWHYTSMADLIVDPTGSRLYLAGHSTYPDGLGGSRTDAIILTYDAETGALLSSRVYEDAQDIVADMALSADGARLFVTGSTPRVAATSSVDRELATSAIDLVSGDVIWQAAFEADGPGREDAAVEMALAPDGATIFVAGYGDTSQSSLDIVTLAYDASTGALKWSSRFDGAGHDVDRAVGIAASADGTRVFVTGSSTGWLVGVGYVTLAYSADSGTLLWRERFDGGGDGLPDTPSDLATTADGRWVVVTGKSLRSGGAGHAIQTLAMDAASGQIAWSARFVSEAPEAASISLDATGARSYVAGQTYSSSRGYNALVLAYELPILQTAADVVSSLGGA